MGTTSVLALSVARLLERQEESATRYVDMELSLAYRPSPEAPLVQWLLTVGGVWDRRMRRYARPAEQGRVIELQPAQDEPGHWLADWCRRFAENDWRGVQRIWSCLLYGGRRGGKSHLACAALLTFAVMQPGAIIWAISPTQEQTAELLDALRSLLPTGWARYRGEPHNAFTFANGSRILFRSGFKPGKLKMGRCDLALLNEAQLMEHRSYIQVRGAVADRGGLVLLTANPPDDPIGMWVQDHQEAIQKGERDAVAFFVDASKNPYIERESLEALQREVDENTYRREVLGEFVPLGDRAIYAWSDTWNRAWIPEHYVDVTREFTMHWLNYEVDTIVGCDFDKRPHCAGAVLRLYVDPQEPQLVMPWVIAECQAENGEEELGEMLLELETLRVRLPCGPDRANLVDPKSCIVIADAQGQHQSSRERRKNLTLHSWRLLAQAGFVKIVGPQWPRSQRNPLEKDRFAVHNMLCRSHKGIRRLHILPSCEHTAKAHREYELKNGRPAKVSDWAHAVDAVGYPAYRLFGHDPKAIEWSPLVQGQARSARPTSRARGSARPDSRLGLAKKIRGL